MRIIFLLVSVLLLTSCSSFISRSKMSAETRYKENFIYYTGTRINYEVLTNQSEKQLFLRYVLGIPDLPLSMIMDTVFVPIDFVVYEKEKYRDKEPQTLMEALLKDSKQMLSFLRRGDLDSFYDQYVDKQDIQTSLFDVDLQNLDESASKLLIDVLETFIDDEFKEPSYLRAERLYFKADDYLLSFREFKGVWLLSTLSHEGDAL